MNHRLADNISAARHACGLNQADLGEAIGRSQKTVAHYESGNVDPPLSVLRRIADATSSSLVELLGLELSHADLLRILARGNGQDSDEAEENGVAYGIVVGVLIKPEPNDEA